MVVPLNSMAPCHAMDDLAAASFTAVMPLGELPALFHVKRRSSSLGPSMFPRAQNSHDQPERPRPGRTVGTFHDYVAAPIP
jgi:hypothetical protein